MRKYSIFSRSSVQQEAARKDRRTRRSLEKLFFRRIVSPAIRQHGLGVPGQYPPLAGSEVELGDATNHLIAIVLKGLQGPVVVEGKPFNNAMQAWEDQYTDSQLASILTYVRSDWGNNAPPITADMVKQIRAEFKDRKEQWTWPEIEKIPPKNLTAGAPPAGQQKPGAPATGSQPPAPNTQARLRQSPPPAANAQPAGSTAGTVSGSRKCTLSKVP